MCVYFGEKKKEKRQNKGLVFDTPNVLLHFNNQNVCVTVYHQVMS